LAFENCFIWYKTSKGYELLNWFFTKSRTGKTAATSTADNEFVQIFNTKKVNKNSTL